jgi:hypothetical protein
MMYVSLFLNDASMKVRVRSRARRVRAPDCNATILGMRINGNLRVSLKQKCTNRAMFRFSVPARKRRPQNPHARRRKARPPHGARDGK